MLFVHELIKTFTFPAALVSALDAGQLLHHVAWRTRPVAKQAATIGDEQKRAALFGFSQENDRSR
jgi:hypothetical protein